MNSKDVVKSELLRRKINEYFSKHPKSKSMVIKSNMNNEKTYWKVTREGKNKFKILEVKSKTDKFIIEEDAVPTKVYSDPTLKQQQYDPNQKPQLTPTPYEKSQQAAKQKMDTSWEPTEIQKNLTSMNRQDFGRMYGMSPEQMKTHLQTQTKMASKGYGKYDSVGGALSGAQTRVLPPPMKTKVAPPPIPTKVGPPPLLPKKKIESKMKKEGRRINEASAQFAQASREFTAAMAPPFNHSKLSSTLNQLNRAIGSITDPNERNQTGSMIGVLTQLVDSTTAQTGPAQVRVTQKPPTNPPLATAGKKIKGKKLKEAEEQDKKKDFNPSGLETDEEPKVEPGKQDKPQKSKSSEQTMFTKSLSGQVIKNAELEPTSNGGVVKIYIQGQDSPLELKWEGDKISFKINNTPYFVRH